MTIKNLAVGLARIEQKVDDVKDDVGELKKEFKNMNGRLADTIKSHSDCKLCQETRWERQRIINGILTFVATTLISVIVYVVIEKPFGG